MTMTLLVLWLLASYIGLFFAILLCIKYGVFNFSRISRLWLKLRNNQACENPE